MFTVALIGLDGVGKTTVARRLEREFPIPLRYLYMGANIEACNYSLPTTRWWWRRQGRRDDRQDPTASGARAPRRGALGRVRHGVRKSVGFANRVAEELYRQLVATRLRRHGFVVLLDRHFGLDYYHGDRSARLPRKRRLQAWLRRRIHRDPDLVICLDAPAEVAFARKHEFTLELLERRRLEYLGFAEVVPHFAVVNADRRVERVVEDVRAQILRFREARLDAAA